ncbi:MAG: ankyrin repeat domain-containing protein [Candidatus Babeliales bacterium]
MNRRILIILISCLQLSMLSADYSGLNKQLFEAVTKNDVVEVQRLVELGADVNAKDEFTSTPLHIAVSKNNFPLVAFLLEKGANVNAKIKDDLTTPLHAAAINGFADIARLLIKEGAHVNLRDKDDKTSLWFGTFEDHKDVVAVLLENKADMYAENKEGNTPFLAALAHSESILPLFIAAGVDVNRSLHFLDQELTPLQLAGIWGDAHAISLLTRAGGDVNAKNKNSGATALHNAAWLGHINAVKELLKLGAHVDIRDNEDANPLHRAVQEGKLDVAYALIDNGADLFTKNKNGVAPIERAADDEAKIALIAHTPIQEITHIIPGILALKKATPELPKDMRNSLLLEMINGLVSAKIKKAKEYLPQQTVDTLKVAFEKGISNSIKKSPRMQKAPPSADVLPPYIAVASDAKPAFTGPLPPSPYEQPAPTTSITALERQQLLAVLKDLNLEEESEIGTQEVTPAAFLKDLKLAMRDILKGFNMQTRKYIGYAGRHEPFHNRFLRDYEAALKLLKAASPHDGEISLFEEWQPYLEQAVDQYPQ